VVYWVVKEWRRHLVSFLPPKEPFAQFIAGVRNLPIAPTIKFEIPIVKLLPSLGAVGIEIASPTSKSH